MFDPNQALVTIECKQYRKVNSKSFANALSDYANGGPKSTVILVNYSDISQGILQRLDRDLRARIFAIAYFYPGEIKAHEELERLLIGSIPKPTKPMGKTQAAQRRQYLGNSS